jgi:hypothetical protein
MSAANVSFRLKDELEANYFPVSVGRQKVDKLCALSLIEKGISYVAPSLLWRVTHPP